jgi:hypothetical protein
LQKPIIERKGVMETVVDSKQVDRNGTIARQYGDTELWTLRNIYGKGFAHDFPNHAKLSELIGRIDQSALALLHRDFDEGTFGRKIRAAGG